MKRHRLIITNLLILFAAYFSFHYYIERALFPKLGMGWAFVIDQTVPLIITLTTTFFLLRQKGGFKTIHTRLKNHYRLLILILTVAFVTHLGILSYYFWSDEVIFMLEPITQNANVFHIIGGANMRGYFITSYAFLYLVFGVLHAWIYPLFSIAYFAISTLFVYWFLYLLTEKRLVATLASLFFATTPIFLDMFTWHSTAHAPILIFGLISFIALLYYQKSGRFTYYILSLMFFFVAIKMGFVRSAGLTLIPILLFIYPFFNKKRGFRFILAHTLPYIMITIYFCVFEFLNEEIFRAKVIFDQTGDLFKAAGYLVQYREVSGSSSFFLSKLSLYTAFLFVPSGLAGDLFPYIRPFFGKVSIALILGNLSLIGFLSGFFIALRRKGKAGWLILFALIFIFLNMILSIVGYESPPYFNPSYPGSAGLLDERLTREDAGYGPGSRYLFISSVGVSLLFGLFITWLTQKRKILYFLAIIFCLVILSGNIYYTIRAQIKNAKYMTEYKSLVENIFKAVPRDGKPKILFSANPEKNGLDTKFSGWNWIYGFYRYNELSYTKDPREVKELIKSNRYTRENLYAFYNNPHTLAFSDISIEARDYFFPKASDIHTPTNLSFQSRKEKSKESILEGSKVNLLNRAVLESDDIGKQIIVPRNLHFKLKIQRAKFPLLPLSDTLFINKGMDKKYLYNFPLKLWEQLALPPKIINNPADITTNVNSEKQFQVLDILRKRANLMAGTSIGVSNMEERSNVTRESLIDGFFTTYPNPALNERLFVSKEDSATLSLSLPYTIGVRRILLNTPDKYSANAPQKITIFSSTDEENFQEIADLENPTLNKWSPNRGKMYQIDLPETFYTRFLEFKISNNLKPIVMDEIVVDGEEALNFSPQDIYETARTAYAYVENQEFFDQLAGISRYDRLSIVWSCADDNDWQSQLQKLTPYPDWGQQQTIKEGLINGIWNVAIVNLPSDNSEVDDSVKINCFGSDLRKVFFISPPYPVEMEIMEATIK